jgi:hypothetical protein
MVIRVFAVLLGFLALGACVRPMPVQSSPIVVNVKSLADECRVSVAPDPVSQALNFVRVDRAKLLQMGRQARSRRAIVAFDER